jgi:small subunit ribosomal protein S6
MSELNGNDEVRIERTTAWHVRRSCLNRLYEGFFLFDANLSSRDSTAIEKFTEELFRRNSVEVVYTERWPDRKLSYEIKGCKKGTYYLTYFRAPPGAIRGIERDCQLSDKVLRLLIHGDDGIEEVFELRRAKRDRGELQYAPEEGDYRRGPMREGRDFREGRERSRPRDVVEEVVVPPEADL